MLRIRRAIRLGKTLNRSSNLPAKWRINTFSKQSLRHALHVMAPTLAALLFAGIGSGVAHAQGTMDFSGAQTLMGTFKTVLEIIKLAGGWHPGLYLKIDNPPFMQLVIEAMDESGPCGLPAISVAPLRQTERRCHARPGDVL